MRGNNMRKFVAGILISIAVAAMSQDRGAEVAGSPAPDFASLEPFVRGLALATREVTLYRVRAATLPTNRHPKPFVIVWTGRGEVTEKRDAGSPETRMVEIGQIDVYPAGTTHSLHAEKGRLRFTMVELRQQNQPDLKALPNKPPDCENVVEFREGGFACLMRIPPSGQITIPELDVNSFWILVDPGRVRETIPRSQWESYYREGSGVYVPGYEEHKLQNLERRPLRLVLIVPPPAQ
jgi:mannose-6-phosphate isomerase-like protein (cupin superfamily)